MRIEMLETSAKNMYDSHVDEVFNLMAKELIGTADAHGYDQVHKIQFPPMVLCLLFAA